MTWISLNFLVVVWGLNSSKSCLFRIERIVNLDSRYLIYVISGTNSHKVHIFRKCGDWIIATSHRGKQDVLETICRSLTASQVVVDSHSDRWRQPLPGNTNPGGCRICVFGKKLHPRNELEMEDFSTRHLSTCPNQTNLHCGTTCSALPAKDRNLAQRKMH